jgi:uncharacterized protein YjiS (DUF1127 family)
MSAIDEATGLGQAAVSTRPVFSLFRGVWDAFQERRKRARLLGILDHLNDRELRDIGIARGEIDYVAANRSSDPRGILSTG